MSGGTDVYTEWNVFMDRLVEEDESYRLLCILAKLGLLDKNKLYEVRNKVLSNMLGPQS